MKSGRSLVSLAQELERQLSSKKDLVVSSMLLRHDTNDEGDTRLVIEESGGPAHYGITPLARRQLAEKLKIPYAYFERMRHEQPVLLDRNVNTCPASLACCWQLSATQPAAEIEACWLSLSPLDDWVFGVHCIRRRNSMPTPVVVPLRWTCVEWHPDETWGKTLLPRLIESGAEKDRLDRSVYVIRLAGNFAIGYPKGESPVAYVGEGSFGSRISSHKKWARLLEELVGEFMFEVCVATPRIKKQENTYLDCEAVLLQRFGERFGSAPLWNKQFERRRFPHHQYSREKLDYVLGKRSGAKYKWALKPMKSSPFYESYLKTHL